MLHDFTQLDHIPEWYCADIQRCILPASGLYHSTQCCDHSCGSPPPICALLARTLSWGALCWLPSSILQPPCQPQGVPAAMPISPSMQEQFPDHQSGGQGLAVLQMFISAWVPRHSVRQGRTQDGPFTCNRWHVISSGLFIQQMRDWRLLSIAERGQRGHGGDILEPAEQP